MIKRLLVFLIIALVLAAGSIIYSRFAKKSASPQTNPDINQTNDGGLINEPNPLSIKYMREQEYPGSDIVIEQTLPNGSNYSRYIASYKSDGLKIYALLTVPNGQKPTTGCFLARN